MMNKPQGVAYIQDCLVNGKLVMTLAVEETGWSFPRVRSRAITICKRLGGVFEKESRGVYIFSNIKEPVAQVINTEGNPLAFVPTSRTNDSVG